MNNEKKIGCCKIIFCIGVFIMCASIGSYFNVSYIIRNQIYHNIVLGNNSKSFDYWSNPPAKIIRKYYFFDVKNSKDIENGRAKPNLKQRGPYCYSEVIKKNSVEFIGKEAVSFKPVTTLLFEPSLSAGNESDLITFLNIPAVGMIHSVMKDNDNDNNLSYMGVNALMKMLDIKLFVTKTVGQLITGYEDPLMNLAKNFVTDVKESKFSLINGRNGTEWQKFTIKTGYEDITQVGQIITWDNKSKLSYWNDEYANTINGSDGTMYPPFIARDQILYAFSPDMCRSYQLEYLKDNTVDGTKTYDFHLPKNIFYNSTLNPDNEGFCIKNCLGNGVLDISKCYGGAPSYISQPHFLNADEKFVNAINGMKPDVDLHDFILQFEPTSGVALTGNVRLQINFYLKNYKKINLVQKTKPVLLPVIWFDEDIKLFSNISSQLRQVAQVVQLNIIIPSAVLCLGMIIVLISLLMGFSEKYKNDNYSQNEKDPNEQNGAKAYFQNSNDKDTKESREPKEPMIKS